MPGRIKLPDFSKFVGMKLNSEVTEEEILQFYHASTARIVEEGYMVTLDFLMDRVNIYVDKDDIITSISMG